MPPGSANRCGFYLPSCRVKLETHKDQVSFTRLFIGEFRYVDSFSVLGIMRTCTEKFLVFFYYSTFFPSKKASNRKVKYFGLIRSFCLYRISEYFWANFSKM